jgi:MoaD family protein
MTIFQEKEKRNMRINTLLTKELSGDFISMNIEIQYLGLVKTYTKKSQEEINLPKGATLKEVLNKMAENYGKEFTKDIYEVDQRDVKTMFTVMVNGVVMGQLNGVDTVLKEGDKIILMPLMTGG